MRSAAPPNRMLPTVAVGFLLLDALLLGYGGLALHRPVFVGVAGGCVVLAAAVVLVWRRYRRALADIAAARRAMRDEALALRELLHRHPPLPPPLQKP